MNNVADEATCDYCGLSFKPRSNNAAFCDRCCRHTCEWCGEDFSRRPRRNRPPRFCSAECTNAWQKSPDGRQKHRAQKLAERGTGKWVACETCGERVWRTGARLGAEHFYCSMKCRRVGADLECPICGDSFRRPPSDVALASVNYCSGECRDKGYLRRVQDGEIFTEPTDIELAGRAILTDMEVVFDEQVSINDKFVVDVLVEAADLIIQWDGDFWHGHPGKYPELSEIQQANATRDRACDAYLQRCGYTVLRFWGSDVKQCPSEVAAHIKSALLNSDST